jgi:Zn-dependent protease with chaperone function/TolA-binding protein
MSRRRRPFAAAVTFALLLVLSPVHLPAQGVDDRELFEKSIHAAEQALRHFGSHDDPAAQERVAEIGYRIAQEAGYRKMPFTFHLIDMPEPNAFALPGGQIFLTRGMLELDLSDDMLAGLIGHEIAHVVREHGLRMQRRATLLNVLSQALTLGVLVAAEQGRDRGGDPLDRIDPQSRTGDMVQGTAAAGMVVSELLLRSYNREFEDEADEEGQRWAAAAGFDPVGTRELFARMRARMPESREYGYWRTHPFFEDRVEAAAVREKGLVVLEPDSADTFRARTQAALLAFLKDYRPVPPEEAAPVERRPPEGAAELAGETPLQAADLLKEAALLAWPQGGAADRLRLEELHALRDRERAEPALSQDYGRLIEVYGEHLEEVQELTPESPLVETLEAEIAGFASKRDELYPRAVEVFDAGVYETGFLATFLSNYPEAPQAPAVAFALGEHYSRLGRQSDAVGQYLRSWQEAPESPAGHRALAGLRRLAPTLLQLGALQQLAAQEDDPALAETARERLAKLASSYDDLANGAEYLRSYPDGPFAEPVNSRLNDLAHKLYAELVLYQAVGDHVKALERIQKILDHAPLSPAAEQLRARAVIDEAATPS